MQGAGGSAPCRVRAEPARSPSPRRKRAKKTRKHSSAKGATCAPPASNPHKKRSGNITAPFLFLPQSRNADRTRSKVHPDGRICLIDADGHIRIHVLKTLRKLLRRLLRQHMRDA